MKATSFAKITRPKLSGISDRARLFRLIDKGRSKPVVWVSAQAGSGKTTLVASYLDSRKFPCLWYQVDQGDGDLASFFYYMGLAAKQAAPRYKKPLPLLTPEYLMGVPVFTRRYFEELFRRLVSPHSSRLTSHGFIIVLDNYQDAPLDSDFHDMLVNGLDVIPEGITVLVLSRADPPQQLARLQANNRLAQIGWDSIRFTREESGELLKLRGRGKPANEVVDLLHKKAEGWAAGLVLLSSGVESASQGANKVSSASLFDYFANEIFNKAEELEQDVLLKTSFLQRISATDAEQLTGDRTAGKVLERLNRRHYFTEMYEHAFQYHPLFREFLLARSSQKFSPTELSAIQRAAAELLEQTGRTEEAAELLLAGGAWDGAERLSLVQAPLLVSQGRSATLAGWLKSFPPERINKAPWLIYWLGVCRVPISPPEGQAYFEQAFRLFQERGDREGVLRSWSGAVNAVIIGWHDYSHLDTLIDWFPCSDHTAVFPSSSIEAEVVSNVTAALFWRRPFHPSLPHWAERALAVSRRAHDPDLRLLAANYATLYYLWIGDFSRLLLVYDEIRDLTTAAGVTPLVKITCTWLESNTWYWAKADHATGLRAFSDVLRIAEKFGVHVWDHMIYAVGVCGFLLQGDREGAERCLSAMQSRLIPDRSHGYCQYHYLSAWCRTAFGDAKGALPHAELAVAQATEIAGKGLYYPEGICRMGLANVLCGIGDTAGAETQLAVARDRISRTGSAILEFSYLLAKAQVALQKGARPAGLAHLRSAMQLGRSKNYVVTFWWWQPEVFARLCREALGAGIEIEYVRELIKLHRFAAEPDQPPDNWPYPIVVNTLGRFEVFLDDEPLRFGSKVQKKPLDLLKVLIAFNGETSEERINEALWPDADGDSAHRSFESALYRLRKLLGEKALRLRDGVLELDKRFCRTDVWDFQQQLKQGAANNALEQEHYFEKAIRLYRGHFLPNDTHQPWSLSLRERLKNDYIRVVTASGRRNEDAGEWEQAIACFQKGIETEELAEEFYQHLMRCHLELGQRVQAESVYRRCCAALSRTLGLAPSPRTEELYASIRKG